MLETAPYLEQVVLWPASGRHILAQFDDRGIVVYQAYHAGIAGHAVAGGRFDGGGFSLGRMSWIKTSFLWMMHRSGWATKPDQERVLAVTIPCGVFDSLLSASVASTPGPGEDPDGWKARLRDSDVRLQWDPDHDPMGRPLARRAIQLGLRGDALRLYALEAPLRILDVTPLVAAQRAFARESSLRALMTPVERPYVPADGRVCAHVALDGAAGPAGS